MAAPHLYTYPPEHNSIPRPSEASSTRPSVSGPLLPAACMFLLHFLSAILRTVYFPSRFPDVHRPWQTSRWDFPALPNISSAAELARSLLSVSPTSLAYTGRYLSLVPLPIPAQHSDGQKRRDLLQSHPQQRHSAPLKAETLSLTEPNSPTGRNW